MNTDSLNGIEQRLVSTIAARRDALLADLTFHVAMPTGGGCGESDALAQSRVHFVDRCSRLGAVCEIIPGQARPDWLDGPVSMNRQRKQVSSPPVAVCRRVQPSKKAVLLAGHLDTVHDPHGEFRSLSIAPDRKTAVGPGCVDMKGGLVIAMHALEALADCGFDANWAFMLNSDEETGSICSDRAIRAEAQSDQYCAALALEPANGATGLVTSRGGSGTFMIDALGKAAHVGRDFASGVSATDALARAIITAHGFSRPSDGLCVNVSPLWCNQPANQVADRAAAWGNVRFADESMRAALESALHALSRGGSKSLPHVAIRTAWQRPAKPETPANMQLAELVRDTAASLGQSITFTRTAGVCDGNNINAANPALPVLDTLGVRGGGLHTSSEWIELSSLVERCQLLAVLIARLTRA